MTDPSRATDPAKTLAALRDTSRDLIALTNGVAQARLARRSRPEEWSAAEVLAHLADAEQVYGVRIRLVLTEERPVLTSFDEVRWIERFGRLDADAKESMARWRALRESNVRVLESLPSKEWARSGLHVERGEMTVAEIASLLVAHDRNHLDQLRLALS